MFTFTLVYSIHKLTYICLSFFISSAAVTLSFEYDETWVDEGEGVATLCLILDNFDEATQEPIWVSVSTRDDSAMGMWIVSMMSALARKRW